LAGIGFELQKLLEDKSVFSKIRAYIIATIITSGPWLLSIIGLSIIGLLTSTMLKQKAFGLFTITIVYTFAFSLIITGPIQFELTRYLADKTYTREYGKMSSALIVASIIVIIISVSLSFLWYRDFPLTNAYKFGAILLFVVMSLIWTLMDFLSCAKRYDRIVASFLIGIIISVALSYIGARNWKEIGALFGYTIGQVMTLIALWKSIFSEYPLLHFWNREFLRYFIILPHIALNGLFYNLGLWIDKILYWIFKGEIIYYKFKAFSYYDIPLFIAYLSIIPSLAHFLIQGETEFYTKYKNFFDSIKDATYTQIKNNKIELLQALYKTIKSLFLIQLTVLIALELTSANIWELLGYNTDTLFMFRKMLIAASLQVMFLYIMIFLMYFDLKEEALISSFLFYFLNHALTLISLKYSDFFIGMGYITALTISIILGYHFLIQKSKNIDLILFLKQGS